MRLVSNTGEAVSTALLLCGGKGDQRHPKRIRFCAEFFLDKRGKDSPFHGQGRTRTSEGLRQQIYSLPPLTAWVPTRNPQMLTT